MRSALNSIVTIPPFGTQRMILAPDARSIRSPRSSLAGWPMNWASASFRQGPGAGGGPTAVAFYVATVQAASGNSAKAIS